MNGEARILAHGADGHRTPVDPREIYLLEARGDETLLRSRSATPLRDVRSLGELLPRFLPHGFIHIHRSFAVNRSRIRDIRPRDDSGDWELQLDPPVNRIVPIGRTHLDDLWRAFGA